MKCSHKVLLSSAQARQMNGGVHGAQNSLPLRPFNFADITSSFGRLTKAEAFFN